MSTPLPGLVAELSFQVRHDDTAAALGSGDVPVLATPRLLAWAEAATVAAIGGSLTGADTSVGTRVELDHRAPSPVGATVRVRAELVGVDHRRLHFEVVVTHADDQVAGTVAITRVVVQRERFLARVDG